MKKDEILVSLDSIKEWALKMKDIVSMFNPISENIRVKQEGEISAYDTLLRQIEAIREYKSNLNNK